MSRTSIAMTTYNGAAYLLPQLQSILNQTRQPDEVVICDDGSSDNTVSIINTFIRSNHLYNWHVFENKSNLGYIQNFRKVLSLTSGDIVFLCDQDDVWHENKILEMACIMEADLQILALSSGYQLIDSNGNRITLEKKKLYRPDVNQKERSSVSQVRMGEVFYANMAQGCTGVYRRSVIEKYCLATECVQMPHDWALNMIAYQYDGLFFLNRELVRYRMHDKNTTGMVDNEVVVRNRIPRVEEYTKCIEDAMLLPIPQNVKEEIKGIVAFSEIRIQWLRHRRIQTWLRGLVLYYPVVRKYFFWQYMKDFALTVLRMVPNENEYMDIR